MNKQRMKWALACAAVVAMAPVSGAMAEGFYFGASLGQAMVDLGSKSEFDALLGGIPATSELDDTGDAWNVQVGYRFNRYVGMEVGYTNFGKADYVAEITNTTQDYSVRYVSSGTSISALGFLPLGERFDIHGRAGYLHADTRVRERLEDVSTGDFVSQEFKASSNELFAGVGAAWNISPGFSLRVEYQKFFDVGDEDQTGEQDIDMVSFGVLFR